MWLCISSFPKLDKPQRSRGWEENQCSKPASSVYHRTYFAARPFCSLLGYVRCWAEPPPPLVLPPPRVGCVVEDLSIQQYHFYWQTPDRLLRPPAAAPPSRFQDTPATGFSRSGHQGPQIIPSLPPSISPCTLPLSSNLG